MRALSPDQLRTFIEVVELGSFTAAAKRLNLSQPAVSLQIRELEARCGLPLLERHSRKPYATEAGRKLLIHANRILKENDEALATMRHLRDFAGDRVRVGMTTTTLSYLVREGVRYLKTEMPNIALSIVLSSSPVLAEDVRNQNLDLAIVTLPVDETNLIVEPFFRDYVTAQVGDDFLSPMPAAITPEMMSRAPFVVQSVNDLQASYAQDWFRASGCAPLGFVEVQSLEACRAAVAAGLGVSFVPGIMTEKPMPNVVSLPLEPPIIRHLAIVSRVPIKSGNNIDIVRAALHRFRAGRDCQKGEIAAPPAVAIGSRSGRK